MKQIRPNIDWLVETKALACDGAFFPPGGATGWNILSSDLLLKEDHEVAANYKLWIEKKYFVMHNKNNVMHNKKSCYE